MNSNGMFTLRLKGNFFYLYYFTLEKILSFHLSMLDL